MPLFTHHPSRSWPPLSSISSGAHRRGSADSTKSRPTIDEDPFAYFITPPPIVDLDEEDDAVFDDWSAGIARPVRPRARSLSPFRLRGIRSSCIDDDGDEYDDDNKNNHNNNGNDNDDNDKDGVVISLSSPPRSPPTPTALTTLRRWMRRRGPRAPRIQPQELSIDDVPALSPLSASPPGTPTETRGGSSSSSDGSMTPKKNKRGIHMVRAHSDRPHSWTQPDQMLWTVVEEDDDNDDDDDDDDHAQPHLWHDVGVVSSSSSSPPLPVILVVDTTTTTTTAAIATATTTNLPPATVAPATVTTQDPQSRGCIWSRKSSSSSSSSSSRGVPPSDRRRRRRRLIKRPRLW